MDGKNKKFKGYLLFLTLLASLLVFGLATLPTAQAQIVIIGAPSDDLPTGPYGYLEDSIKIANMLKAKGYTGDKLVELYGKNATSTNILKAMYNADAVIYIGHGGYQYGHYNGNGGTATPPFSLVGYAPSTDTSGNEFIWGIGDNMRQGWSGDVFTAPFKSNIPVFLLHACFSTGDVEGTQVANQVETIYNFATMFTGAGANYYASANFNGHIIDTFLKGATNFWDANNKINSDEKLYKRSSYAESNIYRSYDNYVAFTGNWAGTFPSLSQVTDYNSTAALAWYNSKAPKASFSYTPLSGLKIGTLISFTGSAYDPDGDTNLTLDWNFGDGATSTSAVAYHAYGQNGTYKVKFKATDSYGKSYTASKLITVGTTVVLKPDLYIVSIKKSGSNRYIKIKNKGTATSKGVHVRIWPGTSSKKHYRQAYVKSLKPGYSTTVKITKYYYKHGKAKVDYTNRVSEKSEANNIRSF
ncbi:MAG: PKD domain-containing protein [Methanobacteriaceae archaeon]|jgi:hypothetical protein|nr:PKD domain-containing protein [Methanobacteriaceae archaeon]MDP2837098.1 PKD domain-containing protein [Methanobacteriaceae archaeon]MDP3484876.1 PKD domain-containing protein [Methanobacteriaceae archaeon]MDP3623305.1 PKD domain-containing protein [Methanobacteriaceae archaeon]